jgi:hypothetical protein
MFCSINPIIFFLTSFVHFICPLCYISHRIQRRTDKNISLIQVHIQRIHIHMTEDFTKIDKFNSSQFNALYCRPYRDVVAESDTKRLKNQIKEGHLRALKGRPRTPTELGWLEGTFTESDATDIGIDIGNHDDYIVTLRKDNINSHRVQKKTGGSVLSVSKNMLLEASLQSLESLGRQRLFGVPVSSGAQGSPILGKGDFMPMCEYAFLC